MQSSSSWDELSAMSDFSANNHFHRSCVTAVEANNVLCVSWEVLLAGLLQWMGLHHGEGGRKAKGPLHFLWSGWRISLTLMLPLELNPG